MESIDRNKGGGNHGQDAHDHKIARPAARQGAVGGSKLEKCTIRYGRQTASFEAKLDIRGMRYDEALKVVEDLSTRL